MKAGGIVKDENYKSLREISDSSHESLKKIRDELSIFELFRLFPDDATARQWFEETRWKSRDSEGNLVINKVCPHCKGESTERVKSGKPQPYRFSALTKTINTICKT